MGLFLVPRGAECREPAVGPLACGVHASGGLDEVVWAPSRFRWSNRLTSFCFCGKIPARWLNASDIRDMKSNSLKQLVVALAAASVMTVVPAFALSSVEVDAVNKSLKAARVVELPALASKLVLGAAKEDKERLPSPL